MNDDFYPGEEWRNCKQILMNYGRTSDEANLILKESSYYYLKFEAPETFKALVR